MSLKIRLTRAGAKKRPYYRIVVADSRSPRDGRFIEKVGTYDPMKPKDDAGRVDLETEKIQAWLAKGAQPTDRVLRFLDAAGLLKRAAQQPPEGGARQEGAGARRRRAAAAAPRARRSRGEAPWPLRGAFPRPRRARPGCRRPDPKARRAAKRLAAPEGPLRRGTTSSSSASSAARMASRARCG